MQQWILAVILFVTPLTSIDLWNHFIMKTSDNFLIEHFPSTFLTYAHSSLTFTNRTWRTTPVPVMLHLCVEHLLPYLSLKLFTLCQCRFDCSYCLSSCAVSGLQRPSLRHLRCKVRDCLHAAGNYMTESMWTLLVLLIWGCLSWLGPIVS